MQELSDTAGKNRMLSLQERLSDLGALCGFFFVRLVSIP